MVYFTGNSVLTQSRRRAMPRKLDRLKRLSLYPLSVEDATGGILATPPADGQIPTSQPRSKRKKRKAQKAKK